MVTVLAEEQIKPVIPEPNIAALAGPPIILPTIANARFKSIFPPAVSKRAPNKTNKKIKSTETLWDSNIAS